MSFCDNSLLSVSSNTYFSTADSHHTKLFSLVFFIRSSLEFKTEMIDTRSAIAGDESQKKPSFSVTRFICMLFDVTQRRWGRCWEEFYWWDSQVNSLLIMIQREEVMNTNDKQKKQSSQVCFKISSPRKTSSKSKREDSRLNIRSPLFLQQSLMWFNAIDSGMISPPIHTKSWAKVKKKRTWRMTLASQTNKSRDRNNISHSSSANEWWLQTKHKLMIAIIIIITITMFNPLF